VGALPHRLISRVLATVTALSLAGCRCGADEPQVEAVDEAARPSTSSVETRPRTQVRRKLVIADAAEIAALDLSTVESIDLALSERDGQERPLPLPEPADAATSDTDDETDTDETEAGASEPGVVGVLDPTAPLDNPRCEGLDLHALAAKAPRLEALRISGCQAAVHSGLSAFGPRLRELELVDLELDAVTVARLSQLHGLDTLALTRVTADPEALKPLARKISPHTIILRELGEDSPVSEIVRLLPDVREIRLIGPWVAHNTMIRVGKARRLERLAIIDTNVQNFSVHQIKGLDHLRELEWSGQGFNNQTPINLRDLPLERLICNCPRLGDKGLRQLYLLPNLRSLTLERSDISSAGLAELLVLTHLEDLTIRYRDFDNAAFLALSGLPLRRLVLGPGRLLEPEATGLGSLVSLRELELDLAGFSDEAAAQLATLVGLERLALGGTAISDDGLTHFANLTNMRELELHHTRVTKHGLAHLSGMRALERLELDHTDVVDEGVAHLANLTNLRELRLDHTLITDAALAHLLALAQLERLNLADTVVTAEGAATLEKLPRLQSVNLAGTRALQK
jgi:hypothetical protein